MTFMAPLGKISKNIPRKFEVLGLYSELDCCRIDCQRYCGGPLRGIVMVPMKNKVLRFPQLRQGAAEVPSDDEMILFSMLDRRFAIRWTVTELSAKPAEVIPMPKQRRRKKTRSTQI
jgi:hypothetical protein